MTHFCTFNFLLTLPLLCSSLVLYNIQYRIIMLYLFIMLNCVNRRNVTNLISTLTYNHPLFIPFIPAKSPPSQSEEKVSKKQYPSELHSLQRLMRKLNCIEIIW